MTVFQRRDGLWGWCLYDDDRGPEYSDESYETADDAKDGLAQSVIIEL